MESFSILSVSWFAVFILILMFWYIFIEILLWSKYFFRKSIERYNNSLVNRFFHYFFWWVIINVLLILLYSYIDPTLLVKYLSISDWLINILVTNLNTDLYDTVIILTSLIYLLHSIILLILITAIVKSILYFDKMVSVDYEKKCKITKDKEMKEKCNKKLKFKIKKEIWK